MTTKPDQHEDLPHLTAQQVKDCRAALGLSAQAFAAVIGLKAGRTVRRMEAGEIVLSQDKRDMVASALREHLNVVASAFFLTTKGFTGAIAQPVFMKGKKP